MATNEDTNKNGRKLRALIKRAGVTQIEALRIFNETKPAIFKPYKMSTWEAFLANPESLRWRHFSDLLLERAEKVFSIKNNQSL